MIDALLFAVRDAIIGVGYGYDTRTCDIREDGHPVPRCGDVYLAVHQGPYSSDMMNALNEYYSFNVTLTMRVTVPLDRIGDQLLARKLAKRLGFNSRMTQLRAFLHMNWGVLQDANNYLLELNPEADEVYGFCEAAHFSGADNPVLVGAEWFAAEPEAEDIGLKAELRFADARRLQPIGDYT